MIDPDGLRYSLPLGWTADNEGSCRSCGAPVLWAINDDTGKKSPFDPVAADKDVRVSHFATCPEADSWRKRK